MSESAQTPAGACSSGVCPFTLIPPDAMSRLIRPPFRKRHPIIFWLGFILAFLLFLSIVSTILDDEDEGSGKDCIALINISGTINNVQPNLEWIRSITWNDKVKGVLVRVDSPGGGASASQELYAALAELGQKKPLAVSMGSTAASGGLMVSMAGQRIFANAATITGSIGVRMDIPQVQGLMGKLGINQETLVSGPYKNAPSYMKPMTEEDRRYLQDLVMKLHGQFVDIIAKGRHMPREKVMALANGKVYTGQEALELGLADAIGGQQEALQWLAEKTGIPASRPLLKRKVSKTRLVERLLDNTESAGLSQALRWLLAQMGAAPEGADDMPVPIIHYHM